MTRQPASYRIEHRDPTQAAKVLEVVDGLVVAQSHFILWMAHLTGEHASGEVVLIELSTGKVIEARPL